jgi:hypothetical protein
MPVAVQGRWPSFSNSDVRQNVVPVLPADVRRRHRAGSCPLSSVSLGDTLSRELLSLARYVLRELQSHAQLVGQGRPVGGVVRARE